ncbi:MAG: universal stress protein [Planctomycetia bacterium]|nr:universal stress protein [Planctomycetia bacterium]
MRKILYPVDFSPYSECALGPAIWLAKYYDAELLVLHAVETPPGWGLGRPEPPLSAAMAEAEWERLVKVWPPDPSVHVRHLLVQGDPAAAILRAVQEHGCDLIVMGTHGRTGLDRMLLGSVAEQVMRGASCPVLTVKVPLAVIVPTETASAVGAV